MIKNKRVAITGLGVVSPLGVGIEKYRLNLNKGTIFLKEISQLTNKKEFSGRVAFIVDELDFDKYYKNLKSDYIPRSTKLLLVSVKLALRDAGLLDNISYGRNKCGVFTSTLNSNINANYPYYGNILLNGPININPMGFPPTLLNYSSSYLCVVNNFQGPNLIFSSGNHAGIEAIGYAANLIKQGNLGVGVINGLNELNASSYAYLNSRRLLCKPNSKYNSKSNIFNSKHKGILLGENASTVIMEDLYAAKKRKARIYAEVLGISFNFGISSDDYIAVMNEAIRKSGLAVSDIDLCVLNTNGFKKIDNMEISAVNEVFKNNLNAISILATKENNGECEGASSILQTLIASEVIYNKAAPRYVYRYKKNMHKNNVILKQRLKVKVRNALINSFDVDGGNASMVVSRSV